MRLSRCHRKPVLPRVLAAAAALLALAGFVPGTLLATAAYARPAAVPVRLAVPVLPPAAVPAAIPPRLYTVRAGDSLSAIARRLCGHANDWTGLYAANRALIGLDPNLIFPGQHLTTGRCTDPSSLLRLGRRSAPVVAVQRAANHVTRHGGSYGHPYFCGDGDGDGWDRPCTTPRHAAAPARRPAAAAVSYGIYSYGALERLWESAGGSPGTAAHAACIAGHESGGSPRAISPTNDWGLWQIHAGGYAMLNPYANARRAIAMSGDGTNWGPWTTARFC